SRTLFVHQHRHGWRESLENNVVSQLDPSVEIVRDDHPLYGLAQVVLRRLGGPTSRPYFIHPEGRSVSVVAVGPLLDSIRHQTAATDSTQKAVRLAFAHIDRRFAVLRRAA